MLKLVRFLAIIFTALALVPVGAHLFALPNKIGLVQNDYFIVQSIYRGWAWLGAVLCLALIFDGVLAWSQRGRAAAFALALVGTLCIAATLAIFFTWTYPANEATNNWTTVPANWQMLRRQWEYSHAINALLTFAALCAVMLSILVGRE